jgi:MFS family permease
MFSRIPKAGEPRRDNVGHRIGRMKDTHLLAAARIVRMVAYGALSVILALYLAVIGFSDREIGLILSLTLLGDAVVSLGLTNVADRLGRRRMLVVGSWLMAGAGLVFAFSRDPWLLTIAAIVGVISPTGKEIGPFLSIEQAALTEIVPPARRTHVFAWYQVFASIASAVGALAGGVMAAWWQARGHSAISAYQIVLVLYAAAGVAIGVLFLRLSDRVEAPAVDAGVTRRAFGLHRSRGVVVKLSALFALDSFAGGFILQSLLAYWFHLRFGVDEATIGAILFGANLVAGLTALSAAWLASRIGLVNTMVVTHLPSNVLLCLVPLMPTLPLAIVVLILRFSISQMDVPTRQSYTVAVVAPDERSAAAGVTTIARSIGAALSPVIAGALLTTSLAAPFYLAGGLKIVYDLLLFRGFRTLRPPEES